MSLQAVLPSQPKGRLIELTPDELGRIKLDCLGRLGQMGFTRRELRPLLTAHVDSVLDVLFRHCDVIRVTTDRGLVCIYPGDVIQ